MQLTALISISKGKDLGSPGECLCLYRPPCSFLANTAGRGLNIAIKIDWDPFVDRDYGTDVIYSDSHQDSESRKYEDQPDLIASLANTDALSRPMTSHIEAGGTLASVWDTLGFQQSAI